jgi:hypothetical protein
MQSQHCRYARNSLLWVLAFGLRCRGDVLGEAADMGWHEPGPSTQQPPLGACQLLMLPRWRSWRNRKGWHFPGQLGRQMLAVLHGESNCFLWFDWY